MRKSLRPSAEDNALEIREIYLLVMGLTGAGKSTFISIVTEDDSIPIGKQEDMDGVTQHVQDYILEYSHHNIHYVIHLIDSPGFDDGTANDAEVLSRIATYVNTIFKLGHTIAGVLYLHDITKAKMGGVGIRNLRMLEKMIGVDKWDNCTLVTTKWGCTTDLQGEEAREKKLRTDEKYFKAMCDSAHNARMIRFTCTRGSALQIINPHLGRKFSPAICVQMVDPKGPKHALKDTDAGQVVAEHLRKLEAANFAAEEATRARKLLEQKFDEKLFTEFKKKRDDLHRQQQMNKLGRWVTRSVILGGSIAATVVTMGPGAGAFVLAPAYEKVARVQKRAEKAKLKTLQDDYKRQSNASENLSALGTRWLGDKKVKELRDINSEEHSLNSRSSMELNDDATNEGRCGSELRSRDSVESTDSSELEDFTTTKIKF